MLAAADVEAAAARIAGRVHRTPVLRCASLDAMAGAALYLKAENLQRVGAFKARGAFNALLTMNDAERERGVIAVSSGNHAQAVALAARELGVPAVIVMPSDANPAKVVATKAYGAEVVQHGVTAENRETFVRELMRERGLPLVHPYDDERVMAGQGTAGLELTEQCEPLDAVVVPVGGGGLLSGVATIVKARWPSARVIGVEPSNAADARASLHAGERVALPAVPDTVVDGVKSQCIGVRPWEVISRFVDDIVTVTDAQTIEAMELLWTRAKTVVEPAGALPLAAVLGGEVAGKRIGLILSGGNVDLVAWRNRYAKS
jgi:threonine dehydratase